MSHQHSRADLIAPQTIVDMAQVISDLQEIVYEKTAYVGQLENALSQSRAQAEALGMEVEGLRAELSTFADLNGCPESPASASTD
jgi:hypothetical protein